MKKFTFLLLFCVFLTIENNAQHTLTLNNVTPETLTIRVDEMEEFVTPTSCGGSTLTTIYTLPPFTSTPLMPTSGTTLGTVALQDLTFFRITVLSANSLPVTLNYLTPMWTPNSFNLVSICNGNFSTGIDGFRTSTLTPYNTTWTSTLNSGISRNGNSTYDDVYTIW